MKIDRIFNAAQQFVLVKDMTPLINFEDIHEEFDKLEYEPNIGNMISKDTTFFDNEKFKQTKSVLVNECKQYLNNVFGLRSFYEDLTMTNSWGNITGPNMFHHEHTHPFSVVSGVLFLDNHAGNLNLTIEAHLPQIPHFLDRSRPFISLRALADDAEIDTDAMENYRHCLVLFLSNLHHYVEQLPKEEIARRRTISFNTFWKGKVGVENKDLSSITF